jgi:hypothetical protein
MNVWLPRLHLETGALHLKWPSSWSADLANITPWLLTELDPDRDRHFIADKSISAYAQQAREHGRLVF